MIPLNGQVHEHCGCPDVPALPADCRRPCARNHVNGLADAITAVTGLRGPHQPRPPDLHLYRKGHPPQAAGQHRCPAPKICASEVHPGQLGAASIGETQAIAAQNENPCGTFGTYVRLEPTTGSSSTSPKTSTSPKSPGASTASATPTPVSGISPPGRAVAIPIAAEIQ